MEHDHSIVQKYRAIDVRACTVSQLLCFSDGLCIVCDLYVDTGTF